MSTRAEDAPLAARTRAMLTDQVVDTLAVIAAQATTAEALVLAGAPAASRAIATVQRSAEEALEALRVLLVVLPEAASPYSPQPGLAEVHLEAARRAGDPAIGFALSHELGRVPAGVQLVVHHGLVAGLALIERGGGRGAVRLVRRGDDVVLSVALGVPVDVRLVREAVADVQARAQLYGGTVLVGERRITVVVPAAGDRV